MTTRKEVIEAVGARYRIARKSERKKILDEFVALTGFTASTPLGLEPRASR